MVLGYQTQGYWIIRSSLLLAQEHEAFYRSALSMENQPRRLQHLARLAVRAQLGSNCRQAATQLPLPPLLRDYLLLCVEGQIR